jgi:hypothetical protein
LAQDPQQIALATIISIAIEKLSGTNIVDFSCSQE